MPYIYDPVAATQIEELDLALGRSEDAVADDEDTDDDEDYGTPIWESENELYREESLLTSAADAAIGTMIAASRSTGLPRVEMVFSYPGSQGPVSPSSSPSSPYDACVYLSLSLARSLARWLCVWRIKCD